MRKEVQKLTCRIAALNRFIAKLTKKSHKSRLGNRTAASL
jgi:hypothetical protein